MTIPVRSLGRSGLTVSAGAVDVVLTSSDLATIDAAFPSDAAAGARYPDMRPIEPLTPKVNA
jgi:hypothetical protein